MCALNNASLNACSGEASATRSIRTTAAKATTRPAPMPAPQHHSSCVDERDGQQRTKYRGGRGPRTPQGLGGQRRAELGNRHEISLRGLACRLVPAAARP